MHINEKLRIYLNKSIIIGRGNMFFTRSIRGRRPKSKKKNINSLIIIFMIMLIVVGLYRYFEYKVMPSLIAIAEMKAKANITTIINTSIKNVIDNNNINTDEFLIYHTNSDGEIVSFGVDTMRINIMKSLLADELTIQMDKIDKYEIKVPFGNAIGNNVFAIKGLYIPVEIIPIGNSDVDYEREFRSTGINQVNHRIWIKISIDYKLIFPISSKDFVFYHQVPVVDRIISGKVPDNYINLPQGNFLNPEDDK